MQASGGRIPSARAVNGLLTARTASTTGARWAYVPRIAQRSVVSDLPPRPILRTHVTDLLLVRRARRAPFLSAHRSRAGPPRNGGHGPARHSCLPCAASRLRRGLFVLGRVLFATLDHPAGVVEGVRAACPGVALVPARRDASPPAKDDEPIGLKEHGEKTRRGIERRRIGGEARVGKPPVAHRTLGEVRGAIRPRRFPWPSGRRPRRSSSRTS